MLVMAKMSILCYLLLFVFGTMTIKICTSLGQCVVFEQIVNGITLLPFVK